MKNKNTGISFMQIHMPYKCSFKNPLLWGLFLSLKKIIFFFYNFTCMGILPGISGGLGHLFSSPANSDLNHTQELTPPTHFTNRLPLVPKKVVVLLLD